MTTLEEGKQVEVDEARAITPKINNPAGPVGLCAFALSTFVLSINSAGSPNLPLPNIVIGLALFYGGLIQILSGMWHLKVGDAFGATATLSYAAFWLTYAANYLFHLVDSIQVPGDPYAADHAVGIYLLSWTIFTFLLTLSALKTNVATLILLFFVNMTFILHTLGKFFQLSVDAQGPNGLTRAGGVFGILTSLMAWYNGFAGLITTETSYFYLPVYDLSEREK